jgi:hypothetical protein
MHIFVFMCVCQAAISTRAHMHIFVLVCVFQAAISARAHLLTIEHCLGCRSPVFCRMIIHPRKYLARKRQDLVLMEPRGISYMVPGVYVMCMNAWNYVYACIGASSQVFLLVSWTMPPSAALLIFRQL